MDPLTHTLVGANLAATRLGSRTRLAAVALIVGANLPDVDAILYAMGESDRALELRRGWTHGILALLVLPLLQTAVLKLWDRTADTRWLLILSTIAIWSHPTLDWLNTYGMRWLMPFRSTWFYGDSVYIMDPWLWLVLGAGWLANRRPTPLLIAVWALFTLAIVRVVGRRAPEYLAVVAIVAAILLATLFWRSTKERATAALVIAAVYIAARLVIHEVMVDQVEQRIASRRLMLSPDPIVPWRWRFVAESADGFYRSGRIDGRAVTLAEDRIPVPRDTPEFRAARAHPSVRGLVTWWRFPAYEVTRRSATETRVLLFDARRGRAGGREVVLSSSF